MAPASDPTCCPLCSSAESSFLYEGTDLLHGGTEVFRYVRCRACGADFQWPRPDPARIGRFYPDDYVAYQVEPPKPARALERAVLRHHYGYAHLEAPLWARALAPLIGRLVYRRALPFAPGARLLDVGCGAGKFLAAMRALGWSVAGLDADQRAVAACAAQGLEVQQGEISGAPLAPGSFDCVTARHVIEHVADPHAFVAGVAAVLRPDGRFHVRTPNAKALGRARYGAAWYANDIPRHLILFSPSNLERLLEQHGFRRISLGTRSTPKILLNSRDRRRKAEGRPARYRRLARTLAKPVVWVSAWSGRGYEIVAEYAKEGGDGTNVDGPGAGAMLTGHSSRPPHATP